MTSSLKREIMSHETTIVFFGNETLDVELVEFPPFSKKFVPRIVTPDDEVLDSFTDEEYAAYTKVCIDHHQTHWPLSTMYIPRRKTKEERKQDLEENKIWKNLFLPIK